MTLRIMLALLVIAPAALAYPWHRPTHQWILGIAVVVVILLFAPWRGAFLTTLIARRWAVWRRNHAKAQPAPVESTAVAMRVEPGAADTVPLRQLTGYLDRYGIRTESVRVISRDADGHRDTWVSVIVDASANLAALQARSADLPLTETASVLARRLAEFLREHGLEVSVDQNPDAPVSADAREGWRSVRDGEGYLTAYAVAVDESIDDRVAELSAGAQCWTVLEFSGTAAHPVVAAASAVRSADQPAAPGVSGVGTQPGRQRPLLDAMDPQSVGRLGIAPAEVPTGLTWSVRGSEPAVSRT